ncbi:MAG: hypothetical protein OXF46_10835 [Rhodobacteraceae bacterium]|nr:hypothetical protein [Paracoccaceae bacterium]
MQPLSDTRDVYIHLVEKSQDDWLIGLLAFSLVEEQRLDWMEHQKKATGSIPSDEEIRKWYAQQPESVLVKAKDEAGNVLGDFFEEAMYLAIQEDRENFRNSLVIDEVKNLGKFWPRFLHHLLFGVLSYALFAVLTIICIVMVSQLYYDISLNELIRNIVQEG